MGEQGGYLFPNDLHILWDLMIVMYPYITGLVAGAFILSSLYHVFRREELRPIGRLALVASLGFLLAAPLTLLLHLGHPLRAFNIMVTPNLSSAMAMFGFIYAGYMTLLLFEIWLVHRTDIIMLASRSTGLKRTLYKCLALGVYDVSEEAKRVDHSVLIVLAGIGIPAAALLHGYVGFIFGAVKANAYWSTPLMPIIFLCSAIVSGIAMVIILYQVGTTFSGRRIDAACMQSLARWLWLFALLSVTLELLEIMTLAYEAAEEWEVIGPLLANQLAFSFIGVQLILGAMVPIILLAIVVLMSRYLTDQLRNALCFVASLLLLLQVFAMRWNVVIGGQIFSKSFRGFREGHTPGLFEREGIVLAILIFVAPLVFIALFNRVLPVFEPPEEQTADGANVSSPGQAPSE
jgi:Ni/Fe-hydrogenase subunit HybB-like protein